MSSMDNNRNWRIPVMITFLLLGFLLTVQFKTQQVYLSDLSLQKTDDLVLMLKRLQTKRAELDRELSGLEREQQNLQASASSGATLTSDLRQDYQRQQVALGLAPVEGPGLTITINPDSPIVYLDLVDIINELWASQAEAIAVNNQRITPWTSIFWNKKDLSITVGGEELTFPCTIKVVGNPDKLEAGLRLLGGVMDDLAVYKVYPEIRRSQMLELPGARPPETRFLQVKKG